jgi:hypothetical protein
MFFMEGNMEEEKNNNFLEEKQECLEEPKIGIELGMSGTVDIDLGVSWSTYEQMNRSIQIEEKEPSFFANGVIYTVTLVVFVIVMLGIRIFLL